MDHQAQEIISIVEIQLGKKHVDRTQRIVDDLGAQSADVVNILAAIEDRFGVFIGEAQIASIRTVQDLIDVTAELMDA